MLCHWLSSARNYTQVFFVCLWLWNSCWTRTTTFTIQDLTPFQALIHHPDTLFSVCLTTNSDQVFHDKSCSRKEAIWSEACIASKSYEWSGFFHIAALLSVLGKPIFSAYPNCITWIRDFLHCEISQRKSISVSSGPLFLLWSREGNLDNRAGAWFSPHHFVPLYTTGENKQKC